MSSKYKYIIGDNVDPNKLLNNPLNILHFPKGLRLLGKSTDFQSVT